MGGSASVRAQIKALRVAALIALVIGLLAVPSTAGAEAPGGLTQLAGQAGCYASAAFEPIAGTTCTLAQGQGQGHGIAISPDQKNVYVVSYYCCSSIFGQTVLVFDRNTATGVLTRKPGVGGCYADDNTGGENTNCTAVRVMNQPRGIVVTNTAVFVAATGSNAIVVFTRNFDGTLTQKALTAGCIVENNSIGGEAGTCADGSLLVSPQGLARSSDGKNLYAASQGSDAVAAFGISSTETLVQTPGTCVQDAGGSGCSDGRALDGPFSLVLSADGSRLYAGTTDDKSIATHVRDSTTGALTPVAGAAACVDDDATDGCTNLGADMGQVHALALRDSHLYAALGDLDRVYLFDRGTSSIARRPGDGGCIANVVTADCATGRGLDFPHGMELSGDGRHLYVTGFNSTGLVELVRANDGSIAPNPGTKGCYSTGSVSTACQTGNGIANGRAVVVTDDGRFVYTTGDFSRTNAFLRDVNPPVCQDGSATIGAGRSIVLNLPCTDDPGDPTEIAIMTPPNGGSVGSVDQAAKQVTFTALSGFSGTTSFTFRATSSGVSSATKTFTINVLPPGCTIGGTAGNDVLVGTARKDVICGLGGNDTIKGLGGNDTLKGAGGKDKLIGGAGVDTLLGGAGNDTLTGSRGKDVLKGQGGADLLLGGAGNDTLTGSGGKDVLKGQAGADLLLAKDGVKDTVNGGPGTDRAKVDRIDRKLSVEKLI